MKSKLHFPSLVPGILGFTKIIDRNPNPRFDSRCVDQSASLGVDQRVAFELQLRILSPIPSVPQADLPLREAFPLDPFKFFAELCQSKGETAPMKPFRSRYHTPYRAAGSTAPFWYSIKRASAHIIVLSSYSAYGKYTPQYQWLQEELPKVNRSVTPWLFVLVHSTWYNSYNYHYMEGETMIVVFEQSFVQHKVDIVFSGHVHSYERSESKVEATSQRKR